MSNADDVRTALQACWDEYNELMPDDLYEQVKAALGIREFEATLNHASNGGPVTQAQVDE